MAATEPDPRPPDEETLARDLMRPDAYPHPAEDIRMIETHISRVFLAGAYAYKVKKPVDLGFLDFTDPDRRRYYCEEELRLNARLAPEIYLSVVPLTLRGGHVRVGGEGVPVEHAVRMRRFRQQDQLDRVLAAGELGDTDMDVAADRIGRFHLAAPVGPPDAPWGTPEQVLKPMEANFTQIRLPDGLASRRGALGELAAWTRERHAVLTPRLEARRQEGHIRECHGDLHLRNMARVEGHIVAFDGIEFDPALRWIDVVSDLAFLVMDLHSRGEPALAWRFLDGWAAVTGDYPGLALLSFYRVYRHLVRAKVDTIRLHQAGVDGAEHTRLEARVARHLDLARETTRPARPWLLITMGLSGSGKSHLTRDLAPRLGAVRLRSDVERKRLFGFPPLASGAAAPGEGIYSPEAGRRTYARLAELAAGLLDAGLPVVVDAAFLDPGRRDAFRTVARDRGLPFVILHCRAPEPVLEDRVARRARGGADPSDAGPEVLANQLAGPHLPAENERDQVIEIDTAVPDALARAADAVGGRLGDPPAWAR